MMSLSRPDSSEIAGTFSFLPVLLWPGRASGLPSWIGQSRLVLHNVCAQACSHVSPTWHTQFCTYHVDAV